MNQKKLNLTNTETSLNRYLRHWNLPNHFWSGVGLFLLIFGLEQAGLFIFTIGFHYHLATLFWILELVLDLMLIYIIFSYKATQSPLTKIMPDFKTGFKRWFNDLLLLMVVSVTYSNLMMRVLGLNLNNHQVSVNQNSILSYFKFGLTPTLAIIASTIVIAPIIEEFCFRVLLIQPDLKRDHKTSSTIRLTAQIILSTAFFALMHVLAQPYFGHEKVYWFYFGQYFVIGLWLALNYVKFNNYRFNIVLHISWNTLSIMIALITISTNH